MTYFEQGSIGEDCRHCGREQAQHYQREGGFQCVYSDTPSAAEVRTHLRALSSARPPEASGDFVTIGGHRIGDDVIVADLERAITAYLAVYPEAAITFADASPHKLVCVANQALALLYRLMRASPAPAPAPSSPGAGSPVAWCPCDRNGTLYVEHASVDREIAEQDCRAVGRSASRFAPFTAVPLFAAPPAEGREPSEGGKMEVKAIRVGDEDDELVAYGHIHVERMSDGHVWMNLGGVSFDFIAEKKDKLTWRVQDGEWADLPRLLNEEARAALGASAQREGER